MIVVFLLILNVYVIFLELLKCGIWLVDVFEKENYKVIYEVKVIDY